MNGKYIFKQIRNIIGDKQISNFDIRIFCTLITYNGLGNIFPSLKSIGKRINYNSISAISRSLNKLRKLNYINIIHRRGRSNIYELKMAENHPAEKHFAEKHPAEKHPAVNYHAEKQEAVSTGNKKVIILKRREDIL